MEAHVPGIGAVNWTAHEVAQHAQLLVRTHQPDRSTWTVRWIVGVLPVPHRRKTCCVSCAQDWPCGEYGWGERQAHR